MVGTAGPIQSSAHKKKKHRLPWMKTGFVNETCVIYVFITVLLKIYKHLALAISVTVGRTL